MEPLSPESVVELLRSIYFSYDGTFYELRDSVAIGSPLSSEQKKSVWADFYMEAFEKQALEAAP